MDRNPADGIKDAMWHFLMTGGQRANLRQLRESVYDLIQAATQKSAGQRKDDEAKGRINWADLDMLLMCIAIEATCFVLDDRFDAVMEAWEADETE